MWYNMYELSYHYARGEGMRHYVNQVQEPEFAAASKGSVSVNGAVLCRQLALRQGLAQSKQVGERRRDGDMQPGILAKRPLCGKVRDRGLTSVLFPVANQIKVCHGLSVMFDAADDNRERRASHPLSTGQSGRAPHSAQEPSYTATGERPSSCKASASRQAEMPDPQVVTTG